MANSYDIIIVGAGHNGLSAAVLPFGVVGLAVAGMIASVIWFPIAWLLGRRFESLRTDDIVDKKA